MSLSDDDREYLLFLTSLHPDDFKVFLDSLSWQEAMRLVQLIQLAKEELWEDDMQIYGTPEADEVIQRIKNKLK